MSKIFVPIKISEEKKSNREMLLFSIKPFDTDMILFNGYEYSVLEQKIIEYFRTESIGFDISYEKNDFHLNQFNDAVSSIQLGVFCSAYSFLKHRQFRTKYDSITITGNFELSERGVELFEISLVEEKFEAAQKYASEHKDEHHLFIYVSPNEVVKEGLYENNLLVIRFDSNSKIEEVFAEVFEPEFTDEQKKCIKELYQNSINEYVQTANFIKWKKEFVKRDCGGLILVGESNTGKSIAARALCEHLVETSVVDFPVWISVNDNKDFLDALRKDNQESLESLNSEDLQNKSIKSLFFEQFSFLENALQNGKKVCLVIDNIEYDYCDEILDYLIKNFDEFSKLLKFILTSWYRPHNFLKAKKLNIIDKEMSEIKLSKLEFFSIVNSVAKNTKYEKKLNDSKRKSELLCSLYAQVPDNPGFVPIALSILLESSVEDLIERLTLENVKDMNPKTIILKIAFSFLNVFSQIVLFASFAFRSKNTQNEEGFFRIFNKDKICWLIQDRFFKSKLQNKVFFTSQNIERALSELQDSNFISKVKNKYLLKKDIIDYCIFSKSENNEISVELENIRNTLFGLYSKVRWSIFLQDYEEFADHISRVKDINKKYDFLLECCESNCDIRFIKNIIESGVDVNHVLEENGTSRIIWKTAYTSSHLDILKFFMEKGAKVSSEDEEGICILTCVNANYEMFDFVFSNYCHKNINMKFENYANKLSILNNYNYLHLVTVLNSNIEIFKKILNLGADYRIKGGEQNSTILHFASVDKKSIEILEYILKNKLYENFYEKTNSGFTALDLARNQKNQKAIELLEKYEKLQSNS